MANTGIDWERIGRDLAAPFDPEAVKWRADSRRGNDGKARVVAYIDARDVQDRLDAVIGPGGWSFELEPLVVDGGELRVARGRLTVYGIGKDDVGMASNTDPSKGCASDAMKRAAVLWGIGRYLYDIPAVRVSVDEKGNLTDATRAQLAASLRRRAVRDASHDAAPEEPPVPAQTPAQDAQPPAPAHSLRLADQRDDADAATAEAEAATAALWEQVKALAASLSLTKAEKTALNDAHPHDPQAILDEMRRMQRRAS